MSRLSDELDDLKYLCSKDNPNKESRRVYRQLRLVWILTILFTFIVPGFWFMRTVLKFNISLIMCTIITIIWVIMLLFSIYSFLSAIKK